MKIINTITQKLERLDPKFPIGIYVCGITPYDTTHLGHAFTFITYDVLIRYLRFLGAYVTYVQNVTDLDDDILIKAKSVGTSWKKLGEFEIKKHLKNMEALNMLPPDFYPYASENIGEMIKIIKVLISKKLAYIKNGSVYFNVKKDKNFGKLSRYGYRAMLEIANERGNFPLDPNKIDPLDFVLWQAQKSQEPYWNSPWGKGRPGWHIECSAMSMKYLGPKVTIHGGGEDLIFPHHDAEIVQSENYTGKKFVSHWMHTAMVYCEGKKMSKSLGNMIFVSDLLKKYSPNAIRIFLLSQHWQKPWNYNEEELKDSAKKAKILESLIKKTDDLPKEKLIKIIPGFFRALDDDFNTAKAIEALFDFAKNNKRRQTGEIVYRASQILGLNF